MSQSSDAAEQVVRMSLQGFEVGLKVTGAGAERLIALILAAMKDKKKTTGKTNLTNMLKSGKELKVFPVQQKDFKKFTEEAKRYGVLYTALVNKKAKDGVVDILVKDEDASKINRIVQRFDLSSFDEITIRGEIQKTKDEKNSVNPHLAKTEKSPLSKPLSKEQKISDKGSRLKDRPSVREKLDKARQEVYKRNKAEVKSEMKNKISKDRIK